MASKRKFGPVDAAAYGERLDECLGTLLRGVGPQGGSASRDVFERLLEAAFCGGVAAALERRCFRHPDLVAVSKAAVPCAPGGGLWLCEGCARPESAAAVFEEYRAANEAYSELETRRFELSREKMRALLSATK